MRMNLTNTMICWKHNSADVALIPWPDNKGLSNRFDSTVGACFSDIQKATFTIRKLHAYLEFVNMVIGDNVCPKAAHNALFELEEYFDGLALDVRHKV